MLTPHIFVTIALANLVWEFAHIPLYSLWETGSHGETIFAAIHCTGGDVLIALSALTLACSCSEMCLAARRIATVAISVGVGYTAFNEWLNIEVRGAWAYRNIMPVIPIIRTGLSPFSQWIVLPILGFWWARRGINDRAK